MDIILHFFIGFRIVLLHHIVPAGAGEIELMILVTKKFSGNKPYRIPCGQESDG